MPKFFEFRTIYVTEEAQGAGESEQQHVQTNADNHSAGSHSATIIHNSSTANHSEEMLVHQQGTVIRHAGSLLNFALC